MSRKRISISIIAAILCLIFGILLGVVIKDFPVLKLDPTIAILDAASLCVTIAIGIFVPFLLKRWIDDSRSARGYLVEELREFLHDVSEIYELTKDYFFAGKITPENKTRINTTFETIDLKLSNLFHELEDFFDKETKPLRDSLKEKYMDYWKCMTGSKIMSDKFKSIDESFYKEATALYLQVETKIKDIIRLMYN